MASVRQGTVASAKSRSTGGTDWKSGERDQDCTCFTKRANGTSAAPTRATPRTQWRAAVVIVSRS